MSFTLQFRNSFPREMQGKFEVYWHLMHPQTIDRADIYRWGWDDEEWNALKLLERRRSDVICSASQWQEWTFTMHFGGKYPEYVPNHAKLGYKCAKGKPVINVKETDLPDALRDELRLWIIEAFRYQRLSFQLLRQLNALLAVQREKAPGTNRYGRTVWKNDSQCKGICNTTSTLYAVWPELLPFMDSESKATLRHRKMRTSLPRVWDEDDLKEFHAVEGMDELTEALSTMSLIPNEKDKYYPSLN